MPTPLAGVVLCGGLSRRMGCDKATLPWEGVPLVEHVIARLRTVCDPVLIAPGGRDIQVPGCAAVDDAGAGDGPLAGVLGSLRASPHPLLAVVGVDMPLIDPALIDLLATRCVGRDAAAPLIGGCPEPLHAVYSRAAISMCETALAGHDRSLRGVLERLDVGYLTEAEWRAAGIAPGFARNLNTPQDLEAVSRPPR